MAHLVLRVRLCSGDHLDVVYTDEDTDDEATIIDHVLRTLAEDGGALRTTHGDRLLILFGRGVAAVEIAPRGAVL